MMHVSNSSISSTTYMLSFGGSYPSGRFGRLKGREFDGDMHEDYSDEDHNSVRTCRVFYTTYDLQRDSDTINPQTHPDIVLRSPETEEGVEAYCQIYLCENTVTHSIRHFHTPDRQRPLLN